MSTNWIYSSVAVVVLAIPFVGDHGRGIEDAALDSMPPIDVPAFDVSGQWQLSWDDEIAGELTGELKQCDVMFRSIDGKLGGQFVGPVAGRERDAIIQGEVHETGSGQLLIFTQREAGYLCSYQVFWSNTSVDRSAEVGVWHDSEGRSGNFNLMKYQ